MGEFIYVAMKGRLRLANPKNAVKQVPDELRGASFIFQSNFPDEVWDAFLSLHIPELHDRSIAAESDTITLSPQLRWYLSLKSLGSVIWPFELIFTILII